MHNIIVSNYIYFLPAIVLQWVLSDGCQFGVIPMLCVNVLCLPPLLPVTFNNSTLYIGSNIDSSKTIKFVKLFSVAYMYTTV